MKRIYFITFISAILSALPFTFPSLFFLSLLAPSAFFYLLLKCSNTTCVKISFLWPVTYHLAIHYYFLALYPLDFAGLSSVASILVVGIAWLGISLFQGSFLGVVFCLYKKFFKSSALVLSALFAICEYLQSLGFIGFPWGQISLTQWKFLPFIQSLSLFGPYFITFLIILLNTLLAKFFLFKNKKYLLIAIAVFVVNVSFGALRLYFNNSAYADLSVGVVQPSITTENKWDEKLGKNSFDVHMSLSEKVKNSDIIIWPETAVASELLTQPYRMSTLHDFIRENDNDFIIGTFYTEKRKTYNSAAYIDKDSTLLYHKRHLVPFGEYVPGRAFFEAVLPFLTDINMLSSDLAKGESANVFDTPHGKIGALVCFDSIFTDLARDSAKNGAELLTIITNDSWYKDSVALTHHNAQAVFRAVENNRYVVRCANTGISSFIDNTGRVLFKTSPNQVGAYQEDVSMISQKSLYTTLGNISIPIFTLLIFLIFVYRKQKRL